MGRAVNPEKRLKELLVPSLEYIEGVIRGVELEPNATRIMLCWKIIQAYGNVSTSKGKKRNKQIEELITGGEKID